MEGTAQGHTAVNGKAGFKSWKTDSIESLLLTSRRSFSIARINANVRVMKRVICSQA